MRLAAGVTLLLATTIPLGMERGFEKRPDTEEPAIRIVAVRSGQITVDAGKDGHVVIFAYQPGDGVRLSYPYRQNQRTGIEQGITTLYGLTGLSTSDRDESVYLIAVRTDGAPRLSDVRTAVGSRPWAPGPRVSTSRSPRRTARRLARLTAAEEDEPQVTVCSIPPSWDFTKWPEYSC